MNGWLHVQLGHLRPKSTVPLQKSNQSTGSQRSLNTSSFFPQSSQVIFSQARRLSLTHATIALQTFPLACSIAGFFILSDQHGQEQHLILDHYRNPTSSRPRIPPIPHRILTMTRLPRRSAQITKLRLAPTHNMITPVYQLHNGLAIRTRLPPLFFGELAHLES